MDYTLLCMLKSVYMKTSYRNQEGDVSGSLTIFNSVLPLMHDYESNLLSQPQLLLWSERLLAHIAFIASDGLDVTLPGSDMRIETSLQAFRHWAVISAQSKETAGDKFGIARPVRRKIEVWKAYYYFLSQLVQHGVDDHAPGEKHNRLHQAAELRRVESSYENELLHVTRFPRANESNRIMEDWVEQVIRNWQVLCGKSWPDAELGEGGRNAIGRNVLDILFRAAMKTFHSTLILRRLFQVHKSLAEFDLAYKALDSYLELVTRGKARAKKSHEKPSDIDDDETVLETISEGIEGLCMFGRKEEAEKAFKLTQTLEEWTTEYSSRDAQINGFVGAGPVQDSVRNGRVNVQTLEIAYRAIGTGKAFWALWTPWSEERSTYQSEALASYRQAIIASENTTLSLETAYAQALLLAESRDLKKAIDCVKRALSTSTGGTAKMDYTQQRRTIPLWHLLALLLTARQDFTTAYVTCGAAFEQFMDPDNLFGDGSPEGTGDTTTNTAETSIVDGLRGLVDDMSGRELERIIEVRITQLALIEIVDGAEEAVNGSNELLSLFSRMFGRLGVGKDERPKVKALVPPKSPAGTIKSLRGSLFGRRKHQPLVSTGANYSTNGFPSESEISLERPNTNVTEAPTIQVTDEDSRLEKHRTLSFRRPHIHKRSDSQSHKLHKREDSKPSIIRRPSKTAATGPLSSVISSPKQSFETGNERLSMSGSVVGSIQDQGPQNIDGQQVGQTSPERTLTANTTPLYAHNEVPETKVPLPPIPHNTDHREVPPPSGHAKQPPQQDVRLPTVNNATKSTQPPTRFPETAEKIHAYGVLVKIWLLIAGLYRRASLHEDSKEACDEAFNSASQIEALVATQESSAAAFADPGWGGGKSSNDAWADVHTERAYLALAKAMPHEALKHFEEALIYSPDHPRATVGLSNILLDIYEQKLPSSVPRPGLEVDLPTKPKSLQKPPSRLQTYSSFDNRPGDSGSGEELRKTPENLNRLAARDRAYGLLSNLTKLGTSWDDSDAWYALARAHECGGQIEKAGEVLWWCVELEDSRPLRHWRNIGPGSYVL